MVTQVSIAEAIASMSDREIARLLRERRRRRAAARGTRVSLTVSEQVLECERRCAALVLALLLGTAARLTFAVCYALLR